MNFDNLIHSINTTDQVLQSEAAKAINKALTARNWLIGLYIVEFEQNGEDRATYGKKLLENLAQKLNSKGLSFRNLKLFRQFYMEYPQLSEPIKLYLTSQSDTLKLGNSIGQTLSAQLQVSNNQYVNIPSDKIFNQLSFGHLCEMLPIKQPLNLTFYEMACIKGTWRIEKTNRFSLF